MGEQCQLAKIVEGDAAFNYFRQSMFFTHLGQYLYRHFFLHKPRPWSSYGINCSHSARQMNILYSTEKIVNHLVLQPMPWAVEFVKQRIRITPHSGTVEIVTWQYFLWKKTFFYKQRPWYSCGINCSHAGWQMNVLYSTENVSTIWYSSPCHELWNLSSRD